METNDKAKELTELYKLLKNYQDLLCDMGEDEFVARGNGFCDSKYSEGFINMQIGKIESRIQALESISNKK